MNDDYRQNLMENILDSAWLYGYIARKERMGMKNDNQGKNSV